MNTITYLDEKGETQTVAGTLINVGDTDYNITLQYSPFVNACLAQPNMNLGYTLQGYTFPVANVDISDFVTTDPTLIQIVEDLREIKKK